MFYEVWFYFIFYFSILYIQNFGRWMKIKSHPHVSPTPTTPAAALPVASLALLHNATGSQSTGPCCGCLSPTDCSSWACSDRWGSEACCLISPLRSRNAVFPAIVVFLQHAVISSGIYLFIHPSICLPSIYLIILNCFVFRAMFEVDMRERGDGSVTLGNQCPAAVVSFLDFAYSGEALITESNVDMLFQLASFLQVKKLSAPTQHPSFLSLKHPSCL